MSVEISRGERRFVTREPGRETRHAFSFGPHYDPDRTSFGPMVCHDEHLLRGGAGFETHHHAGLEIITWVLDGALEHRDSTGTITTVLPGQVALLSAGSGVDHSEVAATGVGPTRFVQVWLTPAEPTAAPAYASHAVGGAVGVLVDTGVEPGVPGARLAVARLEAGQTLILPAAPRTHAYVARGALTRSSLAEPLHAGDAFCFVDEPAHEVTAAVGTELLVWTFTS